VIAVAGLIPQIFYDGVGDSFLDDTRRITSGAAKGRLFALAQPVTRIDQQ